MHARTVHNGTHTHHAIYKRAQTRDSVAAAAASMWQWLNTYLTFIPSAMLRVTPGCSAQSVPQRLPPPTPSSLLPVPIALAPTALAPLAAPATPANAVGTSTLAGAVLGWRQLLQHAPHVCQLRRELVRDRRHLCGSVEVGVGVCGRGAGGGWGVGGVLAVS